MSHKAPSLFDWTIVSPAIAESFRKLNPRLMIKNPVMFVTEIGAFLTTISVFTTKENHLFIVQLAVWLWFTVLFANFAEAVAEGAAKRKPTAFVRPGRTPLPASYATEWRSPSPQVPWKRTT